LQSHATSFEENHRARRNAARVVFGGKPT
jgi:hypothetical protein